MRGWRFLLGGLLVWAVHFFVLYGIASVWLTTPLARALTLLATLVCLGVDALLIARIRRSAPGGEMQGWMRGVALYGAAISLVAVLWQGLPALLV